MVTFMKNEEKLYKIIDSYKLNDDEKKELLSIIMPIYNKDFFQERMSNSFLHHSNITLGEHIIEDATQSYIYSKKKNVDVRLSVIIAMFHDLYTKSWKSYKKKKKFYNLHGFTHPIEACINSIYYYPEYFNDKDAYKIIDGIIHHMFPLPVRCIDNTNLELNNEEIYNKLDDKYKNMIIKSCSRHKLGHFSYSKSLYKEGNILSKADKYVSIKKDITLVSVFTFIISFIRKSITKF